MPRLPNKLIRPSKKHPETLSQSVSGCFFVSVLRPDQYSAEPTVRG